MPIYRKPLFERLGRVADIEYVVACGEPPKGTEYIVAPRPYGFETLEIVNREVSIGGKPLIWQNLVLPFWREFDAAILGDEVKYLSHAAIAVAAKLRRRPVIFWGFGIQQELNVNAATGAIGRFAAGCGARFRAGLMRLGDGYLAYTEAGVAPAMASGFPRERVVVVHNTIDIEEQRRLAASIASESESDCRNRFGLPAEGPVLLYFGRFLAVKRVELLIDYARRCKAQGRNVAVLISGSGAEKENLAARAQGLDNVVFRWLDDADLARAMRITAAIVIPGFVGLAVTHGFAHGVPVITRDVEHPPELAYLAPGENGLILPADEERFFKGLDDYLADTSLQRRLHAGAKAAGDRLSMETMAAGIDDLVRQLLARRFPELSRPSA